MDKTAQLEEIDALRSIYYPEEFQVQETADDSEIKEIRATFWAYVTLPEDYKLKYNKTLNAEEPSFINVKHLPPIELRLCLPDNYPSKEAPKFTISCQWLKRSKISLLCQKLDELWKENQNLEIIFIWTDFLKNETLNYLESDSILDISELHDGHLMFLEGKRHMKHNRSCTKRTELTKDSSKDSAESKEKSSDDKSNDKTVSYTKKNSRKDKIIHNSHSSFSGYSYNHNKKEKYYRKEPYSNNHDKVTQHKYKRKVVYYQSNSRSNDYSQRRTFVQRNKYEYRDDRAVLNLTLNISPVRHLQDYSIERDQIEFLRTCYTCNICFSDKLGKNCTQFKDCNHVFCIDCIRGYFTVRISDGTVQSIKCPEEKCMSEALPSQVKDIVSPELFARYDSLLLNTALDTFNDIIYCPRTFCQYPVSWDQEEPMANCPSCGYAFCVYCKMCYHGIEPCKFKSEEKKKLIEQYQTASDDVKKQMELRYGKKQIVTLVNNSMAESWIKQNSKPCPTCDAAIEKSQGCNKMMCWKCGSYFCWLCGAELDQRNPYLHYSDPYSHCNNKLFHLVPLEEEEGQWEDWDWVEASEEEDEEEGEDRDFPHIEFDLRDELRNYEELYYA